MTGIRIGESTVERITEGNGEQLGQFWEQGRTLGPALDWDWNRDASGQRLAYVSVDATEIGQQAPEEPRPKARWFMSAWFLTPRNSTRSRRRTRSRSSRRATLAGLTDLDTLRHCGDKRVRSAWTGADQWIGLSDGGQGIETFFEVHFPRATLILDFYHAAGH